MNTIFPYFGGKRWLAGQVWNWLGADVGRYIEPFAGGLSVLLARPGGPRPRWQEVINDEYAHIANVWRAIKYNSEQVWENCMDPLHEADLHGRTQRIISRESQMKELMFSDPEWCDPELAGWWIWAQSAHFAQAVIRSGVKAKPNNTAQGIFSLSFCQEYLKKITERLQTVQILCGDFSRVLTNSYLMHEKQIVGVYLDPPYALGDSRTYGQDLDHQSVWNRTVRWAAQNCQNKRLRIVLSGYRGSPGCDMLEEAGMTRHDFQAPQGHSSKNKDNNNSSLESCWISRACVGFNFEQLGLFA